MREGETWMEGWKKVDGHAAVGDESLLLLLLVWLLLLLLLLVCLLDTPHLSLLLTLHPPQNITGKKQTKNGGRYMFAGPGPGYDE